MSGYANNPYSTPEVSTAMPAGWFHEGLDFTQAIKFIWDSPNWIANIVFAMLCTLVGGVIPILPGLVLIGYQCEMLEGMLVRPQQPYPDFKSGRIMDYLVRGFWPFAVGLLAALVILPLILLAVAGPVGLMIALLNAAGRDGEAFVLVVMIPFIIVVALVTSLVSNIALVPFLLRAALTQDFGASLDFGFAQDFVRKMWKETLFAGIFLFLLAIVAQLVGMLLFCVGILFTIPVVQFAQVHLAMQLYRIYLSRGGEKIPLKSAGVGAG